ncbi:unnamed protein product [Linum tenue]|uniref:Uncharacterized protein n=1 Tax=Linum tenue TaxID=586396 RepID=A0AAV0QCB6_9ROSI|nr:unnamed protein product [Linum tenue]CAI0628941.1 unnamed protein product [Linum tenue]
MGRRWVVVQGIDGRVAEDAGEAAGRVVTGGDGGGGMRWCVCSPTTHPGSFRCRYHRAGYVWGAAAGAAASRSMVATTTAEACR